MTNLSILLASADAAFEERIRSALGGAVNGSLQRLTDEVGLTDPAWLASAIAERNPEVIALGPGLPLDEALGVAAALDRDRPDISVLLVTKPSPSVYKRALQAGVRDILDPAAPDEDVLETFSRAVEAARRLRDRAPVEAAPKDHRRIIVILSPKGGSGKTTVATNLAVGLAKDHPGQVALVDLDLQFGDVATAMRLVPEHTVADINRTGRLDAMALKVLLTPHPTGVYALCGPDNPADGEEVTAHEAQQVVKLLSDEFPYVVVDTSAGIAESALAAVEIATDLVVMCGFDVPAIRSLQKLLAALNQLGMTHQARHFLLNRADSRVGLSTADVEATVGMTVDIAVPSSRSVPLSLNQGTPLMESDPRSPVAKQMAALAMRFLEPAVSHQAAGSRLFKRGAR